MALFQCFFNTHRPQRTELCIGPLCRYCLKTGEKAEGAKQGGGNGYPTMYSTDYKILVHDSRLSVVSLLLPKSSGLMIEYRTVCQKKEPFAVSGHLGCLFSLRSVK
jgi:hypothetical protein